MAYATRGAHIRLCLPARVDTTMLPVREVQRPLHRRRQVTGHWGRHGYGRSRLVMAAAKAKDDEDDEREAVVEEVEVEVEATAVPLEVVEPTVVPPPGVEPAAAAPPPEAGKKKVVVLGGNGFVGSAVCKEAVTRGYDVVSVNRSGRPASLSGQWVDDTLWIAADVFDEDAWAYCLQGAWCVVSCIGGFASTVADMERICGDATIAGVEAAAAAQVPRFTFVSVHDYNIPGVLKDNSGYFSGKKRAEEAVMRSFPHTGTVLRPGFIYGDRLVPELGVTVPLGLVGEPVQKILALNPFGEIIKVAEKLPGSDFALKTPVSVESVAACALNYAMDDSPSPGVISVDNIA